MLLTALTVLAVAPPAAPPAIDLEEVLRRARPALERLAAEAELATAARELARSRAGLLEGPSVTAAAGPRRSPEGDDEDLALDLDLPLAGDGSERRAAIDAFEAARLDLLAAARVEADLALRLAYVDAWEAQEALALAGRDLEAVARWRAISATRVQEGAEAPYETSLVAAEVEAARLVLAEARERIRVRWTTLANLAEVGEELQPLAAPEPATTPAALADVAPTGSSALVRAVESRAAFERALANLAAARATSRWSLGASLAREGEEEVARLGVGYRLPLAGETGSELAARDAVLAERSRRAETELAALTARRAGARERAAALGGEPAVSPAEVERALAALAARLVAGKDRPSDVLPLRRRLVASLATAIAARAARLRAGFEIDALTAEGSHEKEIR